LWSRVVLTGSPCQTFPRPRPEEGPEPSAELLLVAIHLCTDRSTALISSGFSGLVSNLVVVCSNLFGVTTFSFTSTNCLISPSTATSCAALPQPRSSRLLAANTRAAGGA